MENLQKIENILAPLGIKLDKEQLHIKGERFLMQKDKFVLTGKKGDQKIVIKISNQKEGIEEIQNERHIREILLNLSFAKEKILFPAEIAFGSLPCSEGSYVFWVTEYIPQEKVFVDYPIEDQFFMILRAFEAQESFHATTYEHTRDLKKIFEVYDFHRYINTLKDFSIPDKSLKEEATELLIKNIPNLAKYSDYLIHTDFVPHNFRVYKRKIYMLDLSSVHFGNKYEGWARFFNYMIIHNPELEKFLEEYIKTNRSEDENLALKLMRIYKIGLLIDFYMKSLPKTEGDLETLTEERIQFWQEILKRVLMDENVPLEYIENYKHKRDNLRSTDEKKRQREFAQA